MTPETTMPRRHTEEKLAALKANLAHHHLDAGQHDLLQSQVSELEQQLAMQPPMDPETLQDQLPAVGGEAGGRASGAGGRRRRRPAQAGGHGYLTPSPAHEKARE